MPNTILPRAFVSFTKHGADRESVATRLLPCLRRQPLDVWIYEDEGGQIPGGQSIQEHLHQQIDRSDVFLPVISQETFLSPYTALEVEYAQQRQANGIPLLIVPLVCQQLQAQVQADWPGPYARLKGIRYRVIDFSSPASLEDAVVELCQKDLNIEYVLPPFTDPRLPYVARFYQEVQQQCPRRDDREVGIYCRLLELLHRFSGAFQREDFGRARWVMQFFCMMCDYEFPKTQFYYPYVVRAVCEQLAGDLDAAEATFQGLSTHPAVDESTWSGLGQLCYLRKNYEQALDYYRRAQERCTHDPAAACGILLNSVMCGAEVDVDQALRVIDQALVQAEDRATVQHVKAVALANAGRFQEATAAFVAAVEQGPPDAATIVHFSRLLTRQGNWAAAIALLERFRQRLDSVLLLHELATCLVHEGRHADAVRVYRTLLDREPHHRRYRVELAQVLWWLGDRQGAQRSLAPLFEPPRQPLPQTADDFFFDGFANWICGRIDRAEYDFQRCGFATENHYRHLLPLP